MCPPRTQNGGERHPPLSCGVTEWEYASGELAGQGASRGISAAEYQWLHRRDPEDGQRPEGRAANKAARQYYSIRFQDPCIQDFELAIKFDLMDDFLFKNIACRSGHIFLGGLLLSEISRHIDVRELTEKHARHLGIALLEEFARPNLLLAGKNPGYS